MTSTTQKPLLEDTQQPQETATHTSAGIRTRNPNKRAVLDRAATGTDKLQDITYLLHGAESHFRS
jgi:hypothetical protein